MARDAGRVGDAVSAVNETIVREYFESLGYLVLQPRKYLVAARRNAAALAPVSSG